MKSGAICLSPLLFSMLILLCCKSANRYSNADTESIPSTTFNLNSDDEILLRNDDVNELNIINNYRPSSVPVHVYWEIRRATPVPGEGSSQIFCNTKYKLYMIAESEITDLAEAILLRIHANALEVNGISLMRESGYARPEHRGQVLISPYVVQISQNRWTTSIPIEDLSADLLLDGKKLELSEDSIEFLRERQLSDVYLIPMSEI